MAVGRRKFHVRVDLSGMDRWTSPLVLVKDDRPWEGIAAHSTRTFPLVVGVHDARRSLRLHVAVCGSDIQFASDPADMDVSVGGLRFEIADSGTRIRICAFTWTWCPPPNNQSQKSELFSECGLYSRMRIPEALSRP